MSDDARSHPPSERRLARLWAAGATPAGPALVAAAVLLAATGLVAALGPALWGGAAGLLRDALVLASEPETALAGAGSLALRGLVAIAAASLALAVVAVGVQLVQTGPRPSGPPGQTARPPDGPSSTSPLTAADAARTLVLLALATTGIAATIRAALIRAGSFTPDSALEAAAGALARAVGGPLLGLVVACAVLDTLLRRAAWTRAAWMSRRELQDELRESEGHPLARRRRPPARRRHHGR